GVLLMFGLISAGFGRAMDREERHQARLRDQAAASAQPAPGRRPPPSAPYPTPPPSPAGPPPSDQGVSPPGSAPPSERGRDIGSPVVLSLEECGTGVLKPITYDTRAVCEECRGAGRPAGLCGKCGGDGRVGVRRTLQARIPPGVEAGQRIRLAGQGEAGRGGGQPSDLFLEVSVLSHPAFTRE